MIKMTDEKMKKDLRASAKEQNGRARKRNTLLWIRRAVCSLAAVLTAYLFSGKKLPFDSYPLGIALVCSSENYVIEYVLGIFIRVMTDRDTDALYFPAILCIICTGARYFLAYAIHKTRGDPVRYADSYAEFFTLRDDISIRASVSAFACFADAVVRVVGGGTFYDLFGAIFGTLAILLFTFLFSFAFDVRYKLSAAAGAGRAAFVFCTVMALTDVRIFTLSAGIIAAYAITVSMGYSGDGARGAVAGLLVGVTMGGDYALIFAFSGLAAGIFYDMSGILSFFMSVGVTVCAGLYLIGSAAVIAMIPEVLIASVAVSVLAFCGFLPDFSIGERKRKSEFCLRELIMKRREGEKDIFVSDKADMLSSLASVIRNMSDSLKRPDRDCFSDMCKEVLTGFCSECPKRKECRGSFDRGLDIVDSITERLMKSGKIAEDKYGEIMQFGCPKKDDIVSEINTRASKMIEENIRADRSGIFAFDYAAAARIIADTVAKGETVYAVDEGLTEQLARAFMATGMSAENLVVCGERKKYIIATGKEVLKSGASSRDILSLCESVCGGNFTLPEYFMDDNGVAMTLESTRIFEVEYAGKQCAKRGEKVCGDAIGVTESREDYFYGFICDGMGSGKDADLTANIGKTFLEKMLSCGNSKSTTLDMLNMFISNKSKECSSTVDLLEIDLLHGKASFTKSGATASYIVRKGRVYKISSDTMPIGLLPEVCAEVTEFSVCDGDLIVMCSDGICTDPETDEDAGAMHLIDYLEREYTKDVSKIAETVISDAARINGRSDDMTVGVFRVRQKWKKRNPAPRK